MAHAQKPEFIFLRNGRVHLNLRGASVQSNTGSRGMLTVMVVMLNKTCSEVVWRVLATHSIRQFPLHFPCRASPCAITLQVDSTFGDRSPAAGTWAGPGVSVATMMVEEKVRAGSRPSAIQTACSYFAGWAILAHSSWLQFSTILATFGILTVV